MQLRQWLRLTAYCSVWMFSPVLMAMDLRQAYEAAHAHDARTRASRLQGQATQERLPQAQAQRLPNISFSAGRMRNDLKATSSDYLGNSMSQTNDYYSQSKTLTISQPLYRPALNAAVKQAYAQVQDAQAMVEVDEQALVQRVGQAYFEALLAQEQVSLIAQQKASHKTQLDAARKGFAAGSGTRTDIDEAQALVDMTVAQELEAQQNQIFTLRNLETLTGQPVTQLAGLNTIRFAPELPHPADLESWVVEAAAHSPEVQALQAQVEAARLEIEKNRAGHKPTLDLVAQWAKTDSDSVTSINTEYDHKSIGLQLTVPIYAGGYVSSTVRQAVALYESAKERLEAARLDLQMRVHREYRGMTEGVLRVAALEQAVRSAQQALISSQKSFTAGSRTTLDVLNAQQQLTAALRDLAQARYQYVLAKLQLHALAGKDRWMNVEQVNGWLVAAD